MPPSTTDREAKSIQAMTKNTFFSFFCPSIRAEAAGGISRRHQFWGVHFRSPQTWSPERVQHSLVRLQLPVGSFCRCVADVEELGELLRV